MSLILNTPPADGDRLLNRIRAEYHEMPGLRVTKAQGQRLWGLDEAGCAAVLAALVATEFLEHTQADTYVKAS